VLRHGWWGLRCRDCGVCTVPRSRRSVHHGFVSGELKVVVAEDHFVTREGLRLLLDGQPGIEVVGAAGDADEAKALVDKQAADVLITDIRMPPTHTTEGIDLAHAVKAARPACGVVVLSQHDDEEYVWSLLADGVSGYAYLHKLRVGDVEQLVRAVREVAAGGSVLDPAIVQRMLAARTGKPGSPMTDLTAGELDALRLMAEGYSNVGIAERCHVAIGTVEKRIAAVFMKLGLTDRQDLNRRVQAVLLYLRESSTGR
jgi:DNA-binding NarL/FixJ family response regulator